MWGVRNPGGWGGRVGGGVSARRCHGCQGGTQGGGRAGGGGGGLGVAAPPATSAVSLSAPRRLRRSAPVRRDPGGGTGTPSPAEPHAPSCHPLPAKLRANRPGRLIPCLARWPGVPEHRAMGIPPSVGSSRPRCGGVLLYLAAPVPPPVPLCPPNFSGATGLFGLKRHHTREQLLLIQPCGKSSRLGSYRGLYFQFI